MKGDFTRFTHDPLKHYTQVLRQQGRVDLDADPNEQVQIDEHLSTTETIDVVGRTGYPRYLGGFEVTDAGGGELAIGFGRMYVDGILCENEAIDAPVASFPAADALVVAERDLARLSGAHVIEVRAPGQVAERRRVTATDPATRRLTLAAALPAALRGAAGPARRPGGPPPPHTPRPAEPRRAVARGPAARLPGRLAAPPDRARGPGNPRARAR